MSYYLGLVGVGLVFVLLIHIYNRWSIYRLRKLEKSKLFGFANTALNHNITNTTAIQKEIQNSNDTINAKLRESLIESVAKQSVQSQKFYENILISNLDKVSSDEINKWITEIKKLPFITQIFSYDKNKNAKILWDELFIIPSATIDSSVFAIVVKAILANRKGFLDINEIKKIHNKLTQLISDTPAKIEIAEINEITTRAQALDHTCAEFDVQIVITLLCRNQSGVSGGQISKASITQGLVFENGGFIKTTAQGQSEYRLDFQVSPTPESLEELATRIGQKATLTIDVPKTKNGKEVFREMAIFAQHLTAVINADLVDDRSQPLSSAALETIGQQIEQIQKLMVDQDFEPGSQDIIRLFN